MIGTKIRGFRHLMRMAKTLSNVEIFFKHNIFCVGHGVAVYVDGEVKNPYSSYSGDYLMIFNDSQSNVTFNEGYNYGEQIDKKVRELSKKYSHLWVITQKKAGFFEDSRMLSEILAVPANFEEKYNEFCELNKKLVANVTKYADKYSALIMYFYVITNGSKNFFLWAANAHFKQGVSLFLLEKIMIWNDNYSQLANKLSKGTITAYTNMRDFFCLVNEMSKLRTEKRANDVINMFNTSQKKALRAYKLCNRDYDTLSKFGKLSNKKKNNFIRKMSTVEDPVEILKQMSFLADVHFEWNKQSLIDFLNNSEEFNCEIVIDKGDMVLLKVKDYETVKRLAKTTNWCISKDKKYWDQYVENNPSATQYVLMDFSRKEDDNLSIVGFTSVHDRGITNAHDFQNTNLMQGKRTDVVSEIKSFVSKQIDCRNIYGILDKYGIKLSDVVTYEPNQYKWDRESMFDYLNQCVDEEDYYIICDYGDKVALIVENDNVRYFLGDAYIDQRGHRGEYGNLHIIFADFSKNSNDPEKLVFGIITHNFEKHESSCARLFNDRFEPINQSFDSKLEEYGLPYDIICRKDNVVDRFYNAITSLELATAKDLLKNKDVRESLLQQERANTLFDVIVNVTFGYNSSDYINLFYDNGYKLGEIIGRKRIGDIARRMISNMIDATHGRPLIVPSKNGIEHFKNGLITDYNVALYVGNFLMLMKVMDNEKSPEFISRLSSFVHDRGRTCDLFDLIMTRLVEANDFENNFDSSKLIIHYAYSYYSPRVINAIEKNKKIDSSLRKLIDSFKKGEVKTTEIWVRSEDGTYVVDGVNEEVAAHAPRKR
jgi:predicted MPP superfamily phosphohydrolase